MLEELVDTPDEWITQRTGIRSRHLLAPGEGLSEIAATAARALEHAGVGADEIDLVVVATSSPDDMFGDAAYVANSVGATRAVAYDITAACSGFLFAVNTAALYLHTGHYGTALVVGADALSRWVDWKDRNSCVLFGDGAGAVVMRAAPSDAEAGLLGYEMHSNGAGRCELQLPYDGAPRPLTETIGEVTRGAYRPIELNGREVYRFATSAVPEVLEEALANAGMRAADVDWLLLHQANIRILETCAKSSACRWRSDLQPRRRQHLRRLDPARPRRGGEERQGAAGRRDRVRRLRRQPQLGRRGDQVGLRFAG